MRIVRAGLLCFLVASCGTNEVQIASGDAAHLVAVAGDPAYAGYRIVLAAGTYKLTTTLTLQAGQSIQGAQAYLDRDGDAVWDPIDPAVDPTDASATFVVSGSETVLDFSARTTAEAIVMTGGNSLSQVTVLGEGRDAESAVGSDKIFLVHVVGTASSGVATVDNCLIESGYHGLGFYPDVSGTFEVDFNHNIIRDMQNGILLGATLADHVTLTANLSKNRLSGTLNDPTDTEGMIMTFNSVNDSTLTVSSTSNVIDNWSDTGVLITAGSNESSGSPPDLPTSNRNTVSWHSVGDQIWRNGTSGLPSGPSGAIWIFAAFDANAVDDSDSSNTVELSLGRTQLVKPGAALQNQRGFGGGAPTQRGDIVAYADAGLSCGTPGTHNLIEITATSVVSDVASSCTGDACSTIFAYDNFNADGDASNAVTFTQDAATFAAVNQGFVSATVVPSLGYTCN